MALDSGVLGVLLKLPVADTMFILSLKESIVECYGVSAKYSNAKNRMPTLLGRNMTSIG